MKRKIILVIMFIMISGLLACSKKVEQSEMSAETTKIYLYGEAHGIAKILDKELALWKDYYQNQGMRHLFMELPYFTAEYLNVWMQSDNDDILEQIFLDTAGTAGNAPEVKEFYKLIKSECPETVFHGTDVGHQYDTIGELFLTYLQNQNMQDSETYKLTQEAIKQGELYYSHNKEDYRENTMAKNFIREFEQLKDESIMGIYGAAHTGLEAMDFTGAVPCMANQLNEKYADIIYSEDISYMAKDIEPYRVDIINVDGKDYEASYFGKEDIASWSKDHICREFWRLENAYDDFIDREKKDNVLPYDDYPMLIELGQIFVIDYTNKDGSIIREYHISDDNIFWENKPATQEILCENAKEE